MDEEAHKAKRLPVNQKNEASSFLHHAQRQNVADNKDAGKPTNAIYGKAPTQAVHLKPLDPMKKPQKKN